MVRRPLHTPKTLPSQPVASLDRALVPIAVTAGFLLFLTFYLVWFYSVPYVAGFPRARMLMLMLVPDQLVSQWFGDAGAPMNILDRVPIVGVALAIWSVAYCLGWLILDVTGIRRLLDRIERFVFSMAIGLAGSSLVTLAIGLAGLLHHRSIFVVLGCLCIAVALWKQGRQRRLGIDHYDGDPKTSPDRLDRWSTVRNLIVGSAWCWLLVPFFIVIALGAMLPPTDGFRLDFDVLEYHLQVPKEWFEQGQITFLPHNVYGNMPLGTEMLPLMAMHLMWGPMAWWWGALAGKLLIAGFVPLTALALYAAGRRFLTVQAGIFAAILYASTAWVAAVSFHGLIDGAVAFYGLLSVYAWRLSVGRSRANEVDRLPKRSAAQLQSEGPAASLGPAGGPGVVGIHGLRDTDRLRLLALTGFMAGTTVACKYTGIVFFVLPLAVAVAWISGNGRAWRLSLFSLAVLVGCGLWLGKNGILTGNPTYPLLVNVFDGATRTPEKDAQWRSAHQVPRDHQGRRYSLHQAWQSLAQVAGRSRWQHPMLIPLALLVVLCWRDRDRWLPWLAATIYLLATWWFLTHRIDRFWIPVLPMIALLAGVGATWSTSKLWRCTVWGVVLAAVVANFFQVSSSLAGDNRYFVDLVQLRDDPAMGTVSPVHGYLNRHIKSGDRVLLVGDAAVFNLQVPNLYNTCFDTCIFERLMRNKTVAQQRQALRTLNVSHILIDWAEIRRYRATYGFTDYVTPELVHSQLVRRRHLLKAIAMPDVESSQAELFEVVTE